MKYLMTITALLLGGCIDDTSPTNEGEGDGDAGLAADVDPCQQGGSAPFCDEGFDPVDSCGDQLGCVVAEYCGATWGCVPGAEDPPCMPPAQACPDGFVQVEECSNPMFCREVNDCGGTYFCRFSDVQCDAIPSCPAGTVEVDCDPAEPGCTVEETCGNQITCFDECNEPGAAPPCEDPLRYRAEACAENEPAACRDMEWCGQAYACVGESEKPILVVECGPGSTNAGPGRCLPGDPARCFEIESEGERFICLDDRCADERPIDDGLCPNVPGARSCYPNEVDCADLPWCGVVYPSCVIDEIDCDAFPACPPGTIDLRLQRCNEEDSDGLCDSRGICRVGDDSCETHVSCSWPVACFDAQCADYEPTCPLDMEIADPDERRACLGEEGNNAGCWMETRCDITVVCVPAQA